MANKEFKDLDVKLHNYIRKQEEFNDSITRNLSIVYHNLILPEIKRQKPKQVCVSAIL